MSKRLFVFFLFLTLTACSKNGMVGEEPPKAMIQVGKETYETKLGSYCWSSNNQGKCVDTAGPVELLKGKNPIAIKPGKAVTFKVNYSPKPEEFDVIQFINNKDTIIPFDNGRFTAPTQKGIYYYSVLARWLDKKDKNISKGDASYVFALEVK